MDPNKAYKTVYKKRININLLLLVLFLFQLLILFLSIKGILIPNSFLSYFITLPNDNVLTCKKVFFKIPKLINIEKVNLFSNKKHLIEFEDINIVSKDYIPSSIKSFSSLQAQTIKLTFFKSQKIINLNNITARLYNNYLNISCVVNSDKLSLKIKCTVNLSKLFKKASNNKNSLDSIFAKIDELNTLIQKNLLKIETSNKIKLACVLYIDENMEFNIIQEPSTQEYLSVSGLMASGLYDLNKGKLIRMFTQLEKILIPLRNTTFELFKSKIFLFNTNRTNNDNSINYFLNFITESINTKGMITGSTSNLSLHLSSNKDHTSSILILDNNSSNCSNSIKWNPGDSVFAVDGFNNFIPDLLDFKIIKKGKPTALFSGDSIKIEMSSSSTSDENIFKNYITILSDNISVLDAPSGNYTGTGTLNNDLSITINNAYGKMGYSEVQGSYSQEWCPLNYKFILNGQCYPTDINNWMGKWWREIWTDFEFNVNDAPFGDFTISGLWGDDSNHSTVGEVMAANYQFRELNVVNSNIRINIDSNITSLFLNQIEHTSGVISGVAKIPRKTAPRSELFNFKMIGDFPVNNGKKLLGGFIESLLDDFNLTTVRIDTHGDLDIRTKNYDSPATNNDFRIVTDTEENGSWNGMKFSSFNGTITKEKNNLIINFPSVESCDGEISFLVDSNLSNKFSNINLKAINLNARQLYHSIISYQSKTNNTLLPDKDLTSISRDGIIDFTINATCTNFDFMSLNGTGKIKITDKELSKIRLLGLLSNGLDQLPLPLPSGTLKFNTLEGLFELENGLITFDRIILSGLLSKVISIGNINLKSGELNIKSKIQLIGNVPIISKIAQIADPLAVFAEIKITGPWNNPKWEFIFNPTK